MAREMLASDAKPSQKAVLHLDRCLSCLSCQTTCGANVQYRNVIDAAREHIERSGVRPWRQRIFRSALATVLTRPVLLKPLMRVGRSVSGLTKRMPGPLGALGALCHAPALDALRKREDAGPDIQVGDGAKRVLLVTGCVQSVSGEEINAAAARLMRRSGLEVIMAPASSCCGALDLHMGRRTQARSHAGKRIEEWFELLDSGQIDCIVSTTSGCGSVMRHYDEVVSDSPELKDKATRVMAAVIDISQLPELLELHPTGCANGLRVAYHDACSMKHGMKLTGAPRKVLRKLGVDVIDIAESHVCCGSAGTYNILQPSIANRLGARKANHANAAKPDAIAAANLGCLVQISRFSGTPVVHTVQLLDWATGGPPPRGLEAFSPPPEREPETEGAAPVSGPGATESTEISLW